MFNQPDPITTDNSDPVKPYIIALLESSKVNRLLLPYIEERFQKGYETYGTYLHTNNGRNHVMDAFEEVLDALIYIMAYRLEKGGANDWVTAVQSQLISSCLLLYRQCTERTFSGKCLHLDGEDCNHPYVTLPGSDSIPYRVRPNEKVCALCKLRL